MTYANEARVRDVVKKVRSLQQLSEMTGTITKRSQGILLQSLSSEELTLAAELMTEGQTNDNSRAEQ